MLHLLLVIAFILRLQNLGGGGQCNGQLKAMLFAKVSRSQFVIRCLSSRSLVRQRLKN